jgi:hypothetical protein
MPENSGYEVDAGVMLKNFSAWICESFSFLKL